MFSEPVVGEKFFGRNEVLDLLNKRVLALKDGYRQNVAFSGQSLAGKTSILQHFLYTIKDEDFIVIYLEIIKEPFRSFANRFIATLLYTSLAKIGEPVTIDMNALLERAQKALPKTHYVIKSIFQLIDKGETDEAYSSLLGLTSVLKSEIHMPCIVILDEFDNLDLLGVKNPFMNFGKVIMVQMDTMYIVTSSRNQAIKKILSEKLSLLFGNFEIVKIGGFDLNTSVDFINTRLAGFEIEGAMKRFLIAFSDGNPFYLHRITSASRAVATSRMSNYIDRDIVVEAIMEQIYDSNGTIHQYLLNFILDLLDTNHRDSYISILVAISSGKNKQQDIARSLKAKSSEVSKGLLRLTELGFISKNGIFYKIDDAVLDFWLKHVYKRKKEILVDDIFNRESLYRSEAGQYIAGFVEEMDRDVIAKIAGLFNLFSNEIIPIDSKSIRLPHFTKVDVRNQGDSKPYIAATFRGNSWVVVPYSKEVDENDIIDYMRSVKSSGLKVSNRVIILLKGIDENAKLLAKELKISMWDLGTVNMLLNLYGKKRFIIL
ncbi:MAG: ATP-binding protein [Candidatus Omnitrophota bacterium]|jgi:predicted transcriptional regulator